MTVATRRTNRAATAAQPEIDEPAREADIIDGGRPLGDFGLEYRELARQRRFIRDSARSGRESVTGGASDAADVVDASEAARRALATAAAVARSTEHRPAYQPDAQDERLSDNAPGMLTEMARMADRLVQARESLGAALARAERAEADLAGMNARMMAARALVHEAQNEMHLANQRAAWLEGRCETLHESLEVAVNASLIQRWMWRRRLLKQRTAPGLTD